MSFKVGIDTRMWDHPGIGRYLRELIKSLMADPESLDYHFSFLSDASFKEYLFSLNNYGTRSFEFRNTTSKIYSISEQFEVLSKSKNVDLLHVPHFNIPVFLKGRLVVTVHDLIYLKEPGAMKSKLGKAYISWLLKVVQKKASSIIAVSEYTKKELLEFLPRFPKDRIFVTYEAASANFKRIDNLDTLQRIKEKYTLQKPFVLYIGSLKAHKNIPSLISALKYLRDTRRIDHELIIIGRQDPKNKELLELIAKNSFVRYLGELPDYEIVSFYNLAEVFVLPSFREGFGLPVLEAMACGTPVMASNRSSLPEVVGNAGILFDPDRIDALGDSLYNVLNNNELRQTLSRKGTEWVKQFSWENTARQTLKIYKEALA